MRTKKFAFQVFALFVIAATVLSACGGGAAAVPAGGVASVPADLLKACKAEGMVTIIATPASWANYGEIFKLFETTTGVKINSLDENAGSADELAAIEANKGNKGPRLLISLTLVMLMEKRVLTLDTTRPTRFPIGTRSLTPFLDFLQRTRPAYGSAAIMA